MSELRDFLAWGSKQNQTRTESFPYGTIAYWIQKYEERKENPDRERARTYWRGSVRSYGREEGQ